MIKITAYNGTVFETKTHDIENAISAFLVFTNLHSMDIKTIERVD